jgi:hAT family C-terminal dimerisation region
MAEPPNSQLTAFSFISSGFVTENPPETLQFQGKSLLRVEHADNRRRGSLRSWIWDKGHQYIDADDPDSQQYWRCGICRTDQLVTLKKGKNISTTNPIRHLQALHPSHCPATLDTTSTINEDSVINEDTSSQLTIAQYLDATKFRRNCLRWLIKSQQPFREVENQDFQQLLIGLNPSVRDYIPTADTIRTWIQREMQLAVEQVKLQLAATLSKIHISFDLWTSPFNSFAVCGIVAHFVDQSWHNQQILLALKRMYGNHTGEDIADVIIPVLKQYELVDRLGVFVGDNASNNDTCVQAILDELDISDPVEKRRSRCLGHIINLVAEAFIFGKDTEAFTQIADSVDESTPYNSKKMQDAQIAWRKWGPIGKLHNIIVFIRFSTQRREAFRDIMTDTKDIDSLMVKLDNSTRWNSTYYSLQRALKIRTRIQQFCIPYALDLRLDLLDDDDWEHLEAVAECLKPFQEATLRLEGNAQRGSHGAIWEALPILEALAAELRQGLKRYLDDKDSQFLLQPSGKRQKTQTSRMHRQQQTTIHPLAVAYQNAWEKLQGYYEKTDEVHEIYAAAVLLHPSFRQQYFDQRWTTPELLLWKPIMLTNVKKQWQDKYTSSLISNEEVNESNSRKARTHEPDFLDRYLTSTFHVEQGLDEFDAYIRDLPVKMPQKEGVFPWVKEECPKAMQQYLLDLLSIPAMSAEIERIFSSTKRLVTPDRNRLGSDTLEELQLLKYWLDHRVINDIGGSVPKKAGAAGLQGATGRL